MSSYADFLASKMIVAPTVGAEIADEDVNPMLFPFQRDLVRWALRKGRSAIFADTGLGKTFMQIEWARLTGEPTLILAPLAVAQQTIGEAEKLGVEVVYARNQSGAGKLTITNYERLDGFDPDQFGAVVLDESSILKSFDGRTRGNLIKRFQATRWRLCCTATPAPNDIAEIGNHAEFFGLMSRAEMLATFFVHDNRRWLLKGHARRPFWRWLASWGMTVRKPSDLGYADEGFRLPGLFIEPLVVEADYKPDGQLFATGLSGITERSHVRKVTAAARVEAATALVAGESSEPWLVWCGLNDESTALTDAIAEAVEVKGADKPETKAEALTGFANGKVRVLVTKPSIAGFGMNFQRCARMVFVGLGDSYEQYYQAIRRCWRFGQTRDVRAYIVVSDVERPIYDNVLRKEQEAQNLQAEVVANVAEFERAEIATVNARDNFTPTTPMEVPAWL